MNVLEYSIARRWQQLRLKKRMTSTEKREWKILCAAVAQYSKERK